MAKKITSITLNNFRAYYGQYETIDLPEGQNVIIYGENGSGKSSLYKAVFNYFQNSNTAISFAINRYNPISDGDIKLSFSEFDSTLNTRIDGTETEYYFGSRGSDNQVPFIQAAALVNGFLDYTDLLKVYFHDDANPNLFDLIVLSLLGNHIPISSGGTHKFRARWNQLQNDLTTRATKRTDWIHRLAFAQLPVYELQLRQTLDEVFNQLNRLLTTYFTDFQIQLDYNLSPLDFHYGWKSSWYTTADLRLQVSKGGSIIVGDYNDFLNEARLSAIAICLYLASLLVNPTGLDVKILYLDDVFIGLDAGNRIPILNILRQEFSSYQKFISTYDRHWFELAKKQFEANDETTWSSIEIYVGTEDISGTIVNKPIIVRGETYWAKAIKFLHHRSSPDYPAAANYFRKALEELLQDFIPPYELVDTEFTQYAGYKLSSVIKRGKNFLEKTGNDSTQINRIIGLLHNLLHPLSHHEISSPIYKGELMIIESSYQNLKAQLEALDISNRYECCLEPGKLVKITFNDTHANYQSCYEINLREPLVIIRDSTGVLQLSLCKCNTDYCYGNNNGTVINRVSIPKNAPNFNYLSLQDAITKIKSFLISSTGHAFPSPADYLAQIEYKDINLNWQPLTSIIT